MKLSNFILLWVFGFFFLLSVDLFLEAFYQTHQINIGKNKDDSFVPMEGLDRGLKRSRTHYIVVPELWNLEIPAGSKNLLKDVPVNQVKKFEKDYIDYLNAKHRDVLDVLKSGKLTPETTATLEAAAAERSKHFN